MSDAMPNARRAPVFPKPVFPKPVLFGIVAAVGLSVVAATMGRLHPAPAPDRPGVVIARDLRFEDGSDGSVIVRLAETGRPIEVLTGEQGFLRGTLRGLARTRKAEGIGSAAPFRLTAWADGALTLEDPETGRHIELSAFGPMNTTVFANLLTAKAAP